MSELLCAIFLALIAAGACLIAGGLLARWMEVYK